MAASLAALAGLLVVRPQDWFFAVPVPPLSAGPPGLSSVTQVYDDTKPGDLIFTVVLTAPASDGGSREQQLGFFCHPGLELYVGVLFMASRRYSCAALACRQLCRCWARFGAQLRALASAAGWPLLA